jgi:hypothetical protein
VREPAGQSECAPRDAAESTGNQIEYHQRGKPSAMVVSPK